MRKDAARTDDDLAKECSPMHTALKAGNFGNSPVTRRIWSEVNGLSKRCLMTYRGGMLELLEECASDGY